MEPPSSYLLDVIIIAFAIVAVAVLSASESAFIAVNKIRIRSLIEKGDARAASVQRILDQHDKLFSVVILSGNLFTILATSMGTVMMIKMLGPEMGIVAATVVLTFLTVIFGELAPKTFAVTHSEKLSLFLARPMKLYIKIVSPLVWIFNVSAKLILRLLGVKDLPRSPYVTEDEIKTMINIGGEEGTIHADEQKLLHRVFEFGDTEVSEVMVPRTEMISVSIDSTVPDVMKLVSEKGYSRYPVVKDSIDNIQGMLYIKDIMMTMAQTSVENLTAGHFMRDAYFIPENKMATKLLDDMRKRNFHVAVVVDEYGGTAGLVTLEDIMEEIVGGLQDEFEVMDAEKDVEIIDERTFIVTGQTEIDELNELAGLSLASDDFNTVGGYVFGLFGRLPKVGEQVRTKYAKFLIMELEERKITRIKVTKL